MHPNARNLNIPDDNPHTQTHLHVASRFKLGSPVHSGFLFSIEVLTLQCKDKSRTSHCLKLK